MALDTRRNCYSDLSVPENSRTQCHVVINSIELIQGLIGAGSVEAIARNKS